ncbi:MAG: ATP-binding protein [Thermoproteus sp.]
MLFDPRPKTRREDLYDRDGELEELSRARSPFVLVTGLRRTGKSSLILVALSGRPHIYIDARAFEERGYISYADLLRELEAAVNNAVGRWRGLLEAFRAVEGVEVAGVSVRFKWGRERVRLVELLERLDEWAEGEGAKLYLVLDEAQELAKLRGVNLLPVLAYSYDHLRNLVFVLSGSEARLLKSFLKLEDPESPLYGRIVDRIELKPFAEGQAVDFLTRGAAEWGMEAKDPRGVYARLGGIPGWLAMYGYKYVTTRSHEEALRETVEAAAALIRREFRNFLIGREQAEGRYLAVMRAAKNCATWSDVKRALEAAEGRAINDAEVSKLIKNLVDYSFLEKVDDGYCPPDPLIREAF